MKSPAQILWEAADVVDQGWCQGGARDAFGNHCAIGAMDLVADLDASLEHALLALRDKVGSHVIGWNDTPGRTALEVSLTMRAVALELDPKLANIGEEIEEVEVIPLTQPVQVPTPIEEPDRELQPA